MLDVSIGLDRFIGRLDMLPEPGETDMRALMMCLYALSGLDRVYKFSVTWLVSRTSPAKVQR